MIVECQAHLGLHSEFKVNLDYRERPVWKNKAKPNNKKEKKKCDTFIREIEMLTQ